MTSEEEERPRFVTGGYGWHRHQWVNNMQCLLHVVKGHRLSHTTTDQNSEGDTSKDHGSTM